MVDDFYDDADRPGASDGFVSLTVQRCNAAPASVASACPSCSPFSVPYNLEQYTPNKWHIFPIGTPPPYRCAMKGLDA